MAGALRGEQADGVWIKDSYARMSIVEMTEAERIAHELAVLVAQEHQRAIDEREKREEAEATAHELAKLLAIDHAALERERQARLSAETEIRELSEWALEDIALPGPTLRALTARLSVRAAPGRAHSLTAGSAPESAVANATRGVWRSLRWATTRTCGGRARAGSPLARQKPASS